MCKNFFGTLKEGNIQVACGKTDDYIQAIFVVEERLYLFSHRVSEVVSTLAKYDNDTRNDN